MSTLVTVSRLTKSFRVLGHRQLIAVSDFSIEIEKGEVLGLIGESGSGKTTVGRCLAGLAPHDSGTISWDIGRPTIGVVFQDPRESMNPKFRLWESIADPLAARGVKNRRVVAQRVREAAGTVGLGEESLHKRPADLTDEVIQRASLARALVVNPELLILDEPTTSLDPDSRAGMLELVNGLRQLREMTALFISHDISAVEKISDRVCIMYLGMIMELGPTAELFRSPRHPYTRALLGSHLALDPEQRPLPLELRGEIPDPLERPPGCPLTPRCPWVTDRCGAQVPELRTVGLVEVACIRAEEIAAYREAAQQEAAHGGGQGVGVGG